MKGIILKVVAGKYYVKIDNDVVFCEIRSSVKDKGKVLVGDYVDCQMDDFNPGNGIICDTFDRRNTLCRPPIANLDKLFIVIAKEPQTDFILVDKLIVYCIANDVLPVLVVGKKDLYTDSEIDYIKKMYKDVVSDIIVVSAKNDINIDSLRHAMRGKLSAFAGQSAVGKSSLLNRICPGLGLRTNTLSKKVSRGQHTTRNTEIYVLPDNIMLADTPGFSLLDLDIKPQELCLYYPEFDSYLNKCKYPNCKHIGELEAECAVKQAVNSGKINKDRYDRYVYIYNSIKEKK